MCACMRACVCACTYSCACVHACGSSVEVFLDVCVQDSHKKGQQEHERERERERGDTTVLQVEMECTNSEEDPQEDDTNEQDQQVCKTGLTSSFSELQQLSLQFLYNNASQIVQEE